MSRLVTKDGLAEALDMSRRSVERMMTDPALPRLHPRPGLVRFDLEAVLRYLADREAQHAQPTRRGRGGRHRLPIGRAGS